MEKDVSHRLENVRIESERELADVARSGVGIEDIVELFGLIAGGLNDFALPKIETNPVEGSALINCRRVERNMAFDRAFYLRCKHFDVCNIPVAAASHSLDSLDAKS